MRGGSRRTHEITQPAARLMYVGAAIQAAARGRDAEGRGLGLKLGRSFTFTLAVTVRGIKGLSFEHALCLSYWLLGVQADGYDYSGFKVVRREWRNGSI